MMELLITVFSATFFVTIIRTTTPLLLATLGGLIADLGGALNVALEGMMLIGCLTAVIVSVYAPWYVAVAAGLGAGALLGLIMAFFAFRLKADIILVAIVARSRPLAVPIVALFYGYLRQGAQLMNIRTDVPAEVIGVVTAIIILLVSTSFSLNIITRLFKRSPAPAAAPATVGGAAK